MVVGVCKPGRRGFTIVELLVGLAITGFLLAAVVAAFNASAISYRENEDIFRAINIARGGLSRMTAQIRTADAVDVNSPANECTLLTSGGEDITYRYDSTDDTLYLVTNDDLDDDDFVLCEDVTAMTFTRNTASAGALVYVKSVQMSMTVTSGNVQKTVAAAAVVRRNLN